MIALLSRRLAQAVPLLLVISLLVFVLIHTAPGGPLAIYLSNPNVRPEDIERLRRALGLDRPLWQQYWSWLVAFAQGDWGYSFSDGRPVASRIVERIPATLELVGTSIVVALALTLPAGVAIGCHPWTLVRSRGHGAGDRRHLASGILVRASPADRVRDGLGWLPSSGRTAFTGLGGGDFADHVQHLLLPVTVLAVVQAAAWSRYLRGSMIETLAQPFVLAARARGIPARAVVLRHALRNALGPVLAIVMVDAALLVSGAVVTESVFAWPGLGSLFTEALARRDYSVLMALLMLTSTAIVLFNVAADALHALIDPRVTVT